MLDTALFLTYSLKEEHKMNTIR